MPLPEAIVWTDGSCSQSKYGGWATLVAQKVDDDWIRTELTGDAYPTTNNAMEMQAAIEGLQFLEEPHHVFLVSDSAYLLSTLRFSWYKKWDEHKRGNRRPNWDLWQILMGLVDFHEVEYVKVKGHSGDPYNDLVDKLALEARKARQRQGEYVMGQ
jgi:ribonuclease HI